MKTTVKTRKTSSIKSSGVCSNIMPLVTVLMPTYNEPLHVLEEAVCSILNQTFQDFEFIIINDNPSRLDLIEALSNFEKLDPRVSIMPNEVNLGLARSLNRGIGLARGDYICRMDADDISESSRIATQLSYLKEFDLDLVGSNLDVIDMKSSFLYSISNLPQTSSTVNKALRFNNCVPHPSWFGKKELFQQKYRLVPLCEDYDFLVRAALAGFKIGNVPEQLLRYRMSSESISRSHLYEQFLYQKELTKCYSRGKVLDIEQARVAVEKSYSHQKALRYARANEHFNSGLASFRAGKIPTAIAHTIYLLFLSPAYLMKIYRLAMASLIR